MHFQCLRRCIYVLGVLKLLYIKQNLKVRKLFWPNIYFRTLRFLKISRIIHYLDRMLICRVTKVNLLHDNLRIRIRIGSVFNRASGFGSVFGIWIQEGKNDQNINFFYFWGHFFYFWEVLNGLYCELQASSVTWTYFMEAQGQINCSF